MRNCGSNPSGICLIEGERIATSDQREMATSSAPSGHLLLKEKAFGERETDCHVAPGVFRGLLAMTGTADRRGNAVTKGANGTGTNAFVPRLNQRRGANGVGERNIFTASNPRLCGSKWGRALPGARRSF